MIRQAQDKDKGEIYRQWKTAFRDDDGGSIDFFFDYLYRNEDSVVLEEHQKIVTSLQSRPKVLRLFGNNIAVNYLVGVVTLPEFRRQGYMDQLMNAVLAESEHQYLMTVLQAYNPKVYEKYGFETVIETQESKIRASMLPVIDDYGVKEVRDPFALKACYDRFTQYFTGYFVRTIDDFNSLIESVDAEGGKIIGLYDEDDLVAYSFIYFNDAGARLDELCYDKASSLLRLISYGLRRTGEVTCVTSTSERLNRVIPGIESIRKPWLMARVNDTAHFDQLYHIKIISAYSAFNAFSIPLFNHDYQ